TLFPYTVSLDIDNNILSNSAVTPISGIVFSSNNVNPYLGKTSLSNVNPSGVNRNGYTVASPATVAPIGFDIPLTLQNGWTANGEIPSVRRERDGTCHITGAVQG